MKNISKIISLLLFTLIIIPQIASAAWWNPFSWQIFKWFSKTETSQINSVATSDEIEKLKKEIEDLKNNNTPTSSNGNKKSQSVPVSETVVTNPPVVPDPVPSEPIIANNGPVRSFDANGKLKFTAYQEVKTSTYINNPKAYLNKPIKLINAQFVDFFQGSNSYLVVIDSSDLSSTPKNIFLHVDNAQNYATALEKLEKWDGLLVYGYAVPNIKLQIVGDGTPYDSWEPAIVIDAVYKCNINCRYIYDNGLTEIFAKKQY